MSQCVSYLGFIVFLLHVIALCEYFVENRQNELVATEIL